MQRLLAGIGVHCPWGEPQVSAFERCTGCLMCFDLLFPSEEVLEAQIFGEDVRASCRERNGVSSEMHVYSGEILRRCAHQNEQLAGESGIRV